MIRYPNGNGESQEIWLKIPFNKDSPNPLTLKILNSGETIRKCSIRVDEMFSYGFQASIGFASDHEAIMKKSENDLSKKNFYQVAPYYTTEVTETLTLYFTGTSSIGAGTIFLEK